MSDIYKYIYLCIIKIIHNTKLHVSKNKVNNENSGTLLLKLFPYKNEM